MANSGQEFKEEMRSIRRSERKYRDLQTIRKDFYPTVTRFILDRNTRFSAVDKDIASRIDDTPMVVNDIIQARLKKISTLAVMNGFGSSEPLDLLTSEERAFYDRVHALVRGFIDTCEATSGSRPVTDESPVRPVTAEPVVEHPPVTAPETPVAADEAIPFPEDPDLFEEDEPETPPEEFPVVVEDPSQKPQTVEEPVRETPPSEPVETKQEPEEDRRGNMIVLRITGEIPMPLASQDGNVYTVKMGQIANLPSDIAGMLINSKLAEKVEPAL